MKTQRQQRATVSGKRRKRILFSALERLNPDLAARLNERVVEMRAESFSYAEIAADIRKQFGVSVTASALWKRLRKDQALAKAVADKVAIKTADILGGVKLSQKSERVKFYERLAAGAEKKGRLLQAAQIVFLIGKELGSDCQNEKP